MSRDSIVMAIGENCQTGMAAKCIIQSSANHWQLWTPTKEKGEQDIETEERHVGMQDMFKHSDPITT